MTNLVEGAAVKTATLALAACLWAAGGSLLHAVVAGTVVPAENFVFSIRAQPGTALAPADFLRRGYWVGLTAIPSMFERGRRLERFVRRKMKHGTLRFVKASRRSTRRALASLIWLASVLLWCVVETIPFAAVALIAGLCDRTLVQTWRRRGVLAAYASMMLGAVVYLRLLADDRTPAAARRLLVLTIVVVGFQRSFFGDTLPLIGFLADLFMVACASRYFVRLCPEPLLREHAVRAEQARDGRIRRRAGPPRRARPEN